MAYYGYCPKCKQPCEIIFRQSRVERRLDGAEEVIKSKGKPFVIPVNHIC